MAFGIGAKLGTVSLCIGLVAIFLTRKDNIQNLEAEIPNILNSLIKAEKKAAVDGELKVAVGFGGCMDIFVDAVPFFKEMSLLAAEHAKHHNFIASVADLLEGFQYFFEHGAAAERYVTNATLFADMVAAAERLPTKRKVVGGNAPVMANRLALEGAKVLLASQGAADFKRMLHENITMAGELVDRNDVHLILEYKTGERWGRARSPRANRYIAIADRYNPTISSLERFLDEYKQFDPKLYVVGGLQVMDNYDFKPGQREERLSLLSKLLAEVRADSKLVHFEMASFVDEQLIGDIFRHVVAHSDSLGMNEQELPNLVSFLQHGTVTQVSEAYPRVAHVLDQMRDLYKLLRARNHPTSRVHVHTLAFQAIMTRVGSAWKNTMSAAAHASLTANRHICGVTSVDVASSKMLMDGSFATSVDTSQQHAGRVHYTAQRPVSCWEETYGDDRVLICVAPNLVCTKVFQTAGGGDNISAAGLRFQL